MWEGEGGGSEHGSGRFVCKGKYSVIAMLGVVKSIILISIYALFVFFFH